MPTHIMLDIETMSTEPNAAVTAIGATTFMTGSEAKTFYTTVDLKTAIACGGRVSGDTIKWWLSQEPVARAAIATASTPLDSALTAFSDWLGKCVQANEGPKDIMVWGNGAAFDNVILRSAYAACGIPAPWPFYNDRCFRTLKNISTVDTSSIMRIDAHTALKDAVYQAACAERIITQLGLVV